MRFVAVVVVVVRGRGKTRGDIFGFDSNVHL